MGNSSQDNVIWLDDEDFMETPSFVKKLSNKSNIIFNVPSGTPNKTPTGTKRSLEKNTSHTPLDSKRVTRSSSKIELKVDSFWAPKKLKSENLEEVIDLSVDISDSDLETCTEMSSEITEPASKNPKENWLDNSLEDFDIPDSVYSEIAALEILRGQGCLEGSILNSSQNSLGRRNEKIAERAETCVNFEPKEPVKKELKLSNTPIGKASAESKLFSVVKEDNKSFFFNSSGSTNTSIKIETKVTENEYKNSIWLPDKTELLRRGSFISNPSDPIIINCPDLSYQAKSKLRRELPMGKKVPGTNFTVDAFNLGPVPGCEAYFLSHYHSDHYGGLGKTFCHGTIIASPITARLVRSQIGVQAEYIQILELNTLYEVNGVRVTLIEANHCPGAVLFLFEIPIQSGAQEDSKKYTRVLHTGDFRVDETIHLDASSIVMSQPIDHLYLDTTYCNPSYAFPTQSQVVEGATRAAVEFYNATPSTNNFSSTLHRWGFGWVTGRPSNQTKPRYDKIIVCGTYSIGKERIFLAIARALKSKIYVTARKRRLLSSFQDPELESLLTGDPTQAAVHVQPMGTINAKKLKEYYDLMKKDNHNLQAVLGVRPTGWTFSNRFAKPSEVAPPVEVPDDIQLEFKPSYTSPNVTIFGVPYSEHSSYKELKKFVNTIAHRHDGLPSTLKVVPTVKSTVGYVQITSWIQGWITAPLPDQESKPEVKEHAS